MKEEKTIVRNNMMKDKNYVPYCGAGEGCHWPRVIRTGSILTCPFCGWKGKLDDEFMKRFSKRWGNSDRETGSEARKLNMIDRVVRLAKIKKEKVEK